MDNIKQAIRSVIKDSTDLDSICSVLVNAAGKDTIGAIRQRQGRTGTLPGAPGKEKT